MDLLEYFMTEDCLPVQRSMGSVIDRAAPWTNSIVGSNAHLERIHAGDFNVVV